MPSILNSDDGVVSGTSGLKSTGGNDGLLNIQSNGTTVVAVTGTGISVTGTVSQTGVSTFAAGTASAPSITFTGDTNTGIYSPTADQVAATAGGSTVWNASSTFGFKNRIINGRMEIDQRNAGASVSTGGSYPVDRFYVTETTSATFTSQRSTTAPTGFTNSLLFTVGTGASAGAAEQAQIRQAIEGFNIADLSWGTANAKSVTISFQVRSSVTGTYCVFLQSSDGGVSYVATYTISAANTFESKSITITGPTSGTFNTDNSTGIMLGWDLGSGSNFTTATTNAWQSGQYRRVSGQENLIGTSGATFYITGVQLEVGSTATSFDFRPYGTELALCQRYYEKLQSVNASYIGMGWSPSTTTILGTISSFYTKRVAPTITASAASDFQASTTGGALTLTSLSFTPAISFSRFDGGVSSGLTIGYGSALRCANSTGYLEISAEL